MSLRILYVISLSILLVPALEIPLRAQEEPRKPHRRTDWDRFDVEAKTRFGSMSTNRMPKYIDHPHSRFSEGLRFGKNNVFLGTDPNVPTSRFREIERPPSLLPSDYLSEQPSRNPEEDLSAVTPAPADVGAPQSKPIRRLPGFFDRSELLEPPPLVTEENLIRSPAEERWFRDLGRRPSLTGLGSPRGMPDIAENSESGQAIAVGGEMLREPGSPENAPNAAANIRSPATDPAVTRRRFERKLEGMLLTDPSVHLLSPVRVSFEGGIATVRGVVPNQQHKVAAGNILLSDPAVKQVNNLISIVPVDPAQNPTVVEPNP